MAKRERKKTGIAWTEITLRPTVDAKTGAIMQKPSIKAGEKVTPEILGIGEREWETLVAERIIRSKSYPSGIKRHEAPKTALLRMARELAEEAEKGGTDEDMYADERMDTEPDDDDDDDEPDINALQEGESEADRLIRLGMA